MKLATLRKGAESEVWWHNSCVMCSVFVPWEFGNTTID